MAKTIKINVTIVPTQGKSTHQTVEVGATGASLRDVLTAAGIDHTNKDLSVNGKPAKLDTHVTPDTLVQAKERGKAPVQVSERPRGS